MDKFCILLDSRKCIFQQSKKPSQLRWSIVFWYIISMFFYRFLLNFLTFLEAHKHRKIQSKTRELPKSPVLIPSRTTRILNFQYEENWQKPRVSTCCSQNEKSKNMELIWLQMWNFFIYKACRFLSSIQIAERINFTSIFKVIYFFWNLCYSWLVYTIMF